MARLLGFFLLAYVAMSVLRTLPGIGGLFRGLLGFWLTVILMSVVFNYATRALVRRRRLATRIRELGHVDSAHNQGKLGTLKLAHGRAREALPHLQLAAAGEPDVAEWHYRAGEASLVLRDHAAAIEALERAATIDEEHAYGGVQMRLAEALLAAERGDDSLAALERFERNHGPNPESAYRRGLALRALGRGDEARAQFEEVSRLASQGAGFKRGENRSWAGRATWARLFTR